MDIYHEHILDLAQHSPHERVLPAPTHAAQHHHASCGDLMQVTLIVQDGVIVDIGWQAEACVLSRAAAGALAPRLLGAAVTDVAQWHLPQVLAALGLPSVLPARTKCVLVFLTAVQRAVERL